MKKYSSVFFPDVEPIDAISGDSVEFIFAKQLAEDKTVAMIIKNNDDVTSEFAFDTEEQIEAIISELYNLKLLLRDAKKSSTESTD